MKLNSLVVDLDGTLIHTDLLFETGIVFLKSNIFNVFSIIIWLFTGKANLKDKLANVVDIDVTCLPYNSQVIDIIKAERKKGREIILATASHIKYAQKISDFLQLFDQVYATDAKVNLSATRKRDRLIDVFGFKKFDYMGNSHDDLKVWAASDQAYVVNPDRGVELKAKKQGNVSQVIDNTPAFTSKWVKQLRFHQWVKNMLLLVPLLASHQLGNIELLIDGFIAFILFGMCASSVYLLNDLLDLEDDRHHLKKRYRPLASGTISIKHGILVTPIILGLSFIGSYILLSIEFTIVLFLYYLLTLTYSMYLKRKVMLDVVTLAMLYTIRIIAGSFAFSIAPTFWMLTFSIFIFLSLALVKRYAELMDAKLVGKDEKTRGRGYYPSDLEMISSLGASSGYISVMVLALYIQDQSTVALYSNPQIIWLACPVLLYWISRIWLITHRGQMHDDPIVFAIKDRVSLLVGAIFGSIFLLASL